MLRVLLSLDKHWDAGGDGNVMEGELLLFIFFVNLRCFCLLGSSEPTVPSLDFGLFLKGTCLKRDGHDVIVLKLICKGIECSCLPIVI